MNQLNAAQWLSVESQWLSPTERVQYTSYELLSTLDEELRLAVRWVLKAHALQVKISVNAQQTIKVYRDVIPYL